MKKIIPFCLCLSLALVGCATTNVQPTEEKNPDTEKLGETTVVSVLATPEIDKAMSMEDRLKLKQLIAKAPGDQKVSWGAGGNQYDFESQKIYVNDAGQPCRDYKLSASLGSFIYHNNKQADLTACRTDEGNWELKQ